MRYFAKASLVLACMAAVPGTANSAAEDAGGYTVKNNSFTIKVNGIDDVLDCRLGGKTILHMSNGTANTTIYNALKKGKNEVTCDVTDNNSENDRSASYEYQFFSGDAPLGPVQKGVCYSDCKKSNPVFTTTTVIDLDTP